MTITAHKTKKIRVEDDLFNILDEALPEIKERTIVAITSKIISIAQGDVIKNGGAVDKRELVKKQADWYFEDHNLDVFGTVIPTVTCNVLIANAGIDESNAAGNYILWPQHIDETTEKIWNYLKEKHNLKHLGILITDSHVAPMRYGTLGLGMSWCGFEAVQDYRGKPDIFGRQLEMTQKNIVDGFACAAVVVMGEGDEQTPIATITDVPFVKFQDHATTPEERKKLQITKEEDIYGKLLNSVEWEKGGE